MEPITNRATEKLYCLSKLKVKKQLRHGETNTKSISEKKRNK